MVGLIISVIICVILSAFFITVRVCKGGVYGLLTKTLASLGFVICGLVAYNWGATMQFNAGMFIVIGLVFGMIGDILLDLKVIYPDDQQTYLNYGMLSFGLGHVAYLVALTILVVNSANVMLIWIVSIIVSAIMSPLTMLASKKMGLDFGKSYTQSLLYSFILIFATVYAIICAFYVHIIAIFACALVLFLASDLVLSIMYFGNKQSDKKLIIINHALYYIAQITIMAFIFVI